MTSSSDERNCRYARRDDESVPFSLQYHPGDSLVSIEIDAGLLSRLIRRPSRLKVIVLCFTVDDTQTRMKQAHRKHTELRQKR